jgi:hypothetical protein
MDMKTMKHSGNKGDGPLSWDFPLQLLPMHDMDGAARSDDDTDVESDIDLPMVLSQEIMAAGGEGVFVHLTPICPHLEALGIHQ